MVNNIPVNGWPQLKDLEAVQPTLDRLDKIEAWKRTVKEDTFTGDDITIENALALPTRSLITEINAIQDLHGLPFPYVGGAYKNKLPMTVDRIKVANTTGTWTGNVYSINNGTVTILTDSDNNITGFKANGTFNANTTFYLATNLPLSGEYIISTTTALPNGCYMSVRGGATADINPNYTDRSFTASGNCSVTIYIPQSANLTNYVYQPMIRLSTESDASFAPYSNICPISGRDSVVLTRSDGDEISEDFTIQLGTTVYGAEINGDTGVMTVKTALVTLNGTEDWNVETTTQSGVYRYSLADGIDNIKLPVNNNTPLECNSNMYVGIAANISYVASKYGISNLTLNSNKLVVLDATYHTNDVTAWKAYLANNPLQVEYTLATPTTIQLTPTQLEMLKGYNHITLSDGYGNIILKALTGANWS